MGQSRLLWPFFIPMKPFFRGFSLVSEDRGLRQRMAIPLLVAGLIYISLLVFGWVGFYWLLSQNTKALGLPDGLNWVFSGFFVYFVWLFIAGPICMAICSVVSVSQWDEMSKRVEVMHRGSAVEGKPPIGISIFDGVMRGVFSLILSVCILLFGWVGFGVVGIALSGILALSEFTGAPLMRRGYSFPRAFFKALFMKQSLGYIFFAGLISILPFISVIFHPALAAGATMLVLEDEELRAKTLPPPVQ